MSTADGRFFRFVFQGKVCSVHPMNTTVTSTARGPTTTVHTNGAVIGGRTVIQTHALQPEYTTQPPAYSSTTTNYPPVGPQPPANYPPMGSQVPPAMVPNPPTRPVTLPTAQPAPAPYGGVPGEHSMYVSDSTNVHM